MMARGALPSMVFRLKPQEPFIRTLHPRQFPKYGTKTFTWSPRKMQKWWRVMCAFGNLEPAGELKDLQERRKAFLELEEARLKDGELLTGFRIHNERSIPAEQLA